MEIRGYYTGGLAKGRSAYRWAENNLIWAKDPLQIGWFARRLLGAIAIELGRRLSWFAGWLISIGMKAAAPNSIPWPQEIFRDD